MCQYHAKGCVSLDKALYYHICYMTPFPETKRNITRLCTLFHQTVLSMDGSQFPLLLEPHI